jgi:hypothetical protein
MGDVHLFVIRVWRHLSQFRASVRSVDEEKPRFFQEPEQVSEFLRQVSEKPPTRAEKESAEGDAGH